jgi:hypothetical protein
LAFLQLFCIATTVDFAGTTTAGGFFYFGVPAAPLA